MRKAKDMPAPSEQDKNLFLQAQSYQQQMQSVLMQKEALSLQMAEVRKALDELEKSAEADVYKIAGTVIVKSPKAAVKKELAEKRDGMEAMAKTLEASEKKIKAKITELKGGFRAGKEE
jgi:prefoldin beta subunit